MKYWYSLFLTFSGLWYKTWTLIWKTTAFKFSFKLPTVSIRSSRFIAGLLWSQKPAFGLLSTSLRFSLLSSPRYRFAQTQISSSVTVLCEKCSYFIKERAWIIVICDAMNWLNYRVETAISRFPIACIKSFTISASCTGFQNAFTFALIDSFAVRISPEWHASVNLISSLS